MRSIFTTVLAASLLIPALLADSAHGQDAISQAKALSRAFRKASDSVRPAVVTIESKMKIQREGPDMRELMNDPRLRQLFPNGLPENFPIPQGAAEGTQVGSGVIIDGKGVILTNSHVVNDADEVVVRLPNGQELKGTEVITDPMSDLAIVRVAPEKSLSAAELGDSSKMDIGDWVIAIGSPFELEATVSAGIISGKGRGIRKIRRGRLLQTDAAINPGNSGGPLVNLDGKVVGINTAIATNNGGYQGIGFAIPSNRAKWISKELLAHGRVRRAYLGIQIRDIDAEAGKQLGHPARFGVWVQRVIPTGPAAEAGLEDGDIITDFAGQRVRLTRDLQDIVEQKLIGSRQTITVRRGDKQVKLQVVMKLLESVARR